MEYLSDAKMTSLKVRNWGKWQSYRKDRGTPPWIKVHRVLFTNPDWAILTDAEKGQLISIWIVAADNNGTIPCDGRVLKKICMLDDEPNINKFIGLGFIDKPEPQHANHLSTTCQPLDAPETETETEEKNTLSPKNGDVDLPVETYKSKKGKLLKNSTLSTFKEFWDAYNYTRGKAEAADSWVAVYSPDIFPDIIAGAKAEAKNRINLVEHGGTPKWAQGWLSGRRWEDGNGIACSSNPDCKKCSYNQNRPCAKKADPDFNTATCSYFKGIGND